MYKVSVIIPVYNEAATLQTLLGRVEEQDIHEIIIVDDASTDHTFFLAQEAALAYGNIKIVRLPVNSGKGKALRDGFALAEGDIILVQDADLEYDPTDYKVMLEAFIDPSVSVVYGSRFLESNKGRYVTSRKTVNKVMTSITNMISGTSLTDVHTCYKAFKSSVIKALALKEDRFGFCTEVTIKAIKAGYVIKEVPVSYAPRSFAEGKKIRFKDGVRSVWCNIKYGIFG